MKGLDKIDGLRIVAGSRVSIFSEHKGISGQIGHALFVLLLWLPSDRDVSNAVWRLCS